ncbi:MAG: hypothetical protein ACXAC7_02610 [Candidatus Hodarchaeales archaeon]
MPLDLEKLDALLEEIKQLEEKPLKLKPAKMHPTSIQFTEIKTPEKKDKLLPTEKKAFFEISHYYKMVMLSLGETPVTYEIWIKGILPLLLSHHSLDLEEWERLCYIGDHDSRIEGELADDWKNFFKETIQQGRVNKGVLFLINKAKSQIKKKKNSMRSQVRIKRKKRNQKLPDY